MLTILEVSRALALVSITEMLLHQTACLLL